MLAVRPIAPEARLLLCGQLQRICLEFATSSAGDGTSLLSQLSQCVEQHAPGSTSPAPAPSLCDMTNSASSLNVSSSPPGRTAPAIPMVGRFNSQPVAPGSGKRLVGGSSSGGGGAPGATSGSGYSSDGAAIKKSDWDWSQHHRGDTLRRQIILRMKSREATPDYRRRTRPHPALLISSTPPHLCTSP